MDNKRLSFEEFAEACGVLLLPWQRDFVRTTLIRRGRQNGKSRLGKLASEILLDAGKTITVLTPEITVIKRRKRHLTLIERVPIKAKTLLFLTDECP
jgi:hypothetical protein